MDHSLYKNYSACRICLQDSNDKIPLFDEKAEKYLQLIEKCVGLSIIQNDVLPSNICSTCVSELTIIEQFISKCKGSHEKLEKLLILTKNAVNIKEECENYDSILNYDEIKIEYINDTKFEDFDECGMISDDGRCDDNIKPIDDGEFTLTRARKRKRLETEAKPVKRKYTKRKLRVNINKVEKKEFVCNTCDAKFSNKATLISHTRKHTGEKPFVCDICSSCFSQSSTLLEHKGRVHNLNEYISRKKCLMCDHCGKVCYRKSELATHSRVHTKEKPFSCDYCHKTFAQKGSLISHIRIHQGIKPFTCHICGSRHSSRSNLSSHMKVHSDEKNYQCHVCNKTVKSSGTLRVHLKSHVEAKPFACDKCGGRYSQKVNLKHHILTQHSDRSGICDICKKNFADISAHSQIHNGERPFKCTHCDKAYIKNSHLIKHMKRIRESSKFQCNSCEATFALHSQLEFHTLKYHTKEFAFKCSACSQGFYRLADFKRHQNRNLSCKLLSLKNQDDKICNP